MDTLKMTPIYGHNSYRIAFFTIERIRLSSKKSIGFSRLIESERLAYFMLLHTVKNAM